MSARHLTLIPGGASAPCPLPELPRPALSTLAALDLEQAERFLLSLEAETAADLAGPRAAYLLGQAEGFLTTLTQMVRGLTS